MATFEECVVAAKRLLTTEIGKSFDGVEFVSVILDSPVVFKARANNHIILTSQDTNEEFDKFYKVVTRK